jgi:hypothetical protein
VFHKRYVLFALGSTVVLAPLEAQQLLAPRATHGRTVTPVFEGWYRNPDGTFSLSFGYYNRNTQEVVEIPIGQDNLLSLGELPPSQPTRFHPGRHWGIFAIMVPHDFSPTRRVVWTLKNRGETFAIPGSLHPDWEIDALEGEASAGNTPPRLRFIPNGPEGRGPGGHSHGPLEARVEQPLELNVWVEDDGKGASNVVARQPDGAPVTLTWFKHQGPPGEVTFSTGTARVASNNGTMRTTATFATPGDYVLRVRANDASGVTSGGHAQCCWTNGFVRVTVKP